MLRIPESIETETNIMADTGSRWCHDPGRDKATRIGLTQKGNLAKVT